jgi:hypothetical protein
MPKFQITAPDGANYEITAPDGATESEALSHFQSQWKPTEKQESYGDVAARMGARALTGLGELAVDMPLSAGQWVGNKINDAIGQPHADFNTHPVRSMTDAGLKAIDVNPQSSGAAESIAQAGISALTGSGIAKGLGDVALSAMPIRQAVGAMSGATANESLKDSGLPDAAKMALSLGAGIAGSNIAGAVGGIGKGIGGAAKTVLTEEGRREAAGRALYRQTTNPDQVIERLKNQDLRKQHVPNSAPISAEIAQDGGFSMLGKSLAANPHAVATGADQIHNQRIADLSNSLEKYLNRANRVGTGRGDDAMVVLDRLKSSKLDPFLAGNDLRNTAVNGASIIPTLESQFAKFAGNGKVEKFIEKSAKNLFPNAKIERVNGELKIIDAGDSPNFNHAWNARKGLDDLLYDKKISLNSAAETKGAAHVAGGAIRTSINDALKQANPDFEGVLGTLAKANKMQTALETGRKLQDTMKNSATTAVQNEYDMVGVNKYSPSQGTKIGKDLVNSRGQPSDLAKKMTKSQREAFENVAKELERSKALESMGASVGSPTASYIGRSGLLKDDILDSILGARKQGDKPGLLRMAGQGLGGAIDKIGITAPLEESVMQNIKAGLINPDEALTLLEMGRRTQRGLLDVGGGIKKSTQAGLLGGLLAR